MINSAGTLQLARSAAEAGVRQFYFISTVLVHGRSNAGRAPFSEEDTLTPHGVYGVSKAEAEAGLKALASETDMKISTIRPPLVYGAGAKGNFALLTRAVSLGLPLPLAKSIINVRLWLCKIFLGSLLIDLPTRIPTAISRPSWLPTKSRYQLQIYLPSCRSTRHASQALSACRQDCCAPFSASSVSKRPLLTHVLR